MENEFEAFSIFRVSNVEFLFANADFGIANAAFVIAAADFALAAAALGIAAAELGIAAAEFYGWKMDYAFPFYIFFKIPPCAFPKSVIQYSPFSVKGL